MKASVATKETLVSQRSDTKVKRVEKVKLPDNKSAIKVKLLHVGNFVSTRRKICYYA